MSDNLGPLPRVHPRIGIGAKADAELGEFVYLWVERNGLTTSEALSVLARELSRCLDRCVASERKPKG